MTTTEIWHARTVGEATCAALKKNGFDARFVETVEQAADYIESVVTAGASVGLGGSMTIRALELKDRLENKGARLLDHSAQGLSAEQKMDVMRAQLSCDVFLSS
nr:LUD domain-containing protein [Treponemataceae bacterium]